MEKEIRLTSEMFYALLQGKKLEQITNGERMTIYPPHYGLYLTHEMLNDIKKSARHAGAMETYELLEKLSKLG